MNHYGYNIFYNIFYKNLIIFEAYYIDFETGNRDGTSIVYYENGMKKESCEYVNGFKEGKMMQWYDDGNIKCVCTYVNDSLHGESIEYHRNGNIKVKLNYDNDTITDKIVISYNINGKKEVEYTYDRGMKNGVATFYGKKGNRQVRYVDDVLVA